MSEYCSDSFVVRCERRDGKPDDETYFDNKYDARNYFNSLDDSDDKTVTEKYRSITVVQVDWNYRADYLLDGVDFDE